jgi:exo-beta-1,3-glucanase (GH17 family)/beta-glucanase (GH16 family)
MSNTYRQSPPDLLAAEVMGVAYSGFRAGQHPDRGSGAVNPSAAQISEDLDILVRHGFRLIRLYDSGANSETVLQTIRERNLPIKVLLGIWVEAEVSNHEGCPWCSEPIPAETLAENTRINADEITRGIKLAQEYTDIVVAVNVGNEALVDWNDHMLTLASIIDYVRRVKGAIQQPVTVADNYLWWIREGAPLADEVDFIGVHSYPAWEHKSIDEGLAYTIENIEAVHAALPGVPIVVLEAGWATTAIEFSEQASEVNQRRYFNELRHWAQASNTTVLFFEAFDEPWKGDPQQALGAEKHWGLFGVDRRPKLAMQGMPSTLYDTSAVVWAVNVGGGSYTGIDGVSYQPDEFVSGGEVGVLDAVVGAQDSEVYKSYRSGELKLFRPIENGVYDITFQFAEPEDASVDERVFDVLIQGEKVIDALNVRRTRSGSHLSALKRTVTGVVVTDGHLDIRLLGRSSTPILNGLVVRSRRPDPRTWKLEWADEFEYSGMPDPTRWTAELWGRGRVNDEDQAYTDRSKNVRVEEGRLILEAHREDYGDAKYTSARILSLGKGDFLYGRVDIRARLPLGQGTWPALWMLPSDPYRYATNCRSGDEWLGMDNCDAWPNSGEIDIMEHVGYDMKRVHGTVHNRTFFGGRREQRSGSVEVADVEQAFHVYSLNWTPQSIDIFIDGVLYYSYLNEGTGWQDWPFDHPFHLIMNLAIGGWWGRAGGPIDDSIFPTRMEVDYVRVFSDTAITGADDKPLVAVDQ